MRGRPSKLTPALQESICKTLVSGVDVETACLREGIGHSTYREWVRRGIKGEAPFEDFVLATEQAMANVEVGVTANILKATRGHWQAAAWYLKWKHQRAVQRVELSGPNGAPLGQGGGERGPVQLTAEGAEAIRRQILFGDAAPKALTADAQEPEDAELITDDDFGTEGEEP